MDYIEEVFTPLVEKCKSLGRAMRIGTNHGAYAHMHGFAVSVYKFFPFIERTPYP